MFLITLHERRLGQTSDNISVILYAFKFLLQHQVSKHSSSQCYWHLASQFVNEEASLSCCYCSSSESGTHSTSKVSRGEGYFQISGSTVTPLDYGCWYLPLLPVLDTTSLGFGTLEIFQFLSAEENNLMYRCCCWSYSLLPVIVG